MACTIKVSCCPRTERMAELKKCSMDGVLPVPNKLNNADLFSRAEFIIDAYREEYPGQSDEAAIYTLRKLLKENGMLREGWNQYVALQQQREFAEEMLKDGVKFETVEKRSLLSEELLIKKKGDGRC